MTLLNARNLRTVPLSPAIVTEAARIRAAYQLKTPDAIQLATAEEGGSHRISHERCGACGLMRPVRCRCTGCEGEIGILWLNFSSIRRAGVRTPGVGLQSLGRVLIWAQICISGSMFPTMWPHCVSLLYRSWESFLHAMGTTGLGFFTPVLVFITTVVLTLTIIGLRQGKAAMKAHWKQTAALTTCATLAVMVIVYGPIFSWNFIKTIYDDHAGLVSANAQLAAVNRDYVGKSKEAESENNKLERTIEQLSDENARLRVRRESGGKASSVSDVATVPAPPIIRASTRNLGVRSDGRVVTQFRLVSDTKIPPPLVIEMDFDFPIDSLAVLPMPRPAAELSGGQWFNGTHGFATVPFTGIGPNLVWLVTVTSEQAVHLTSPPRPRTGY
jgi:hypothetical protein